MNHDLLPSIGAILTVTKTVIYIDNLLAVAWN